MMKELHIDLETFSPVDLSKRGVYRYAEDAEILLFAFSVDGSLVQVIDLASGEKIPPEIIEALADPSVTKWAYNSMFERVILSSWLKKNGYSELIGYGAADDTTHDYLDPHGWKCSMVWASYVGLPKSLENTGEVLGLEQQKLKTGKELIRYFCMPCSPTKRNGGRIRNLPSHDKSKWSLFKDYNKRDVEVEILIQKRIAKYPVSDVVWEEYWLDQTINDRGIGIDIGLVRNAVEFDSRSKAVLMDALRGLTELENPNSVVQLKQWLNEHGLEAESLDKKALQPMMKDAPEMIRDVLRLRLQVGKSSVRKYQAMENVRCSDGRARGCFQFYGGKTGRWAGRLIQLQNLPQNHLDTLDEARSLVSSGDYETLDLLYDNVPEVLSQLIRTALVPRPGYLFYVADFSAIEARVLSWLAGEKWRMETFKNNEDIYCATASRMFGVPVEKHGQNAELRQKGKIAELGLGYGGSVGALKSMGALSMGINEEELQPIVDAWRKANPRIVALWKSVDRASKEAVINHTETSTHGIGFRWKSHMLFVVLPSGRELAYVKPRMGLNRFGTDSITYEGTGATKKWERLETFAGKWVENIVQAIARDILCFAMQNLSEYFICAHVHDEVIIEAPESVSLDEICRIMGQTPPWAEGLDLRADGYITPYYRKD